MPSLWSSPSESSNLTDLERLRIFKVLSRRGACWWFRFLVGGVFLVFAVLSTVSIWRHWTGWSVSSVLSPFISAEANVTDGHDYDSATEHAAKHLLTGPLLHPDRHIYRAPEIIYLDWRVTLGVRDPDGVKKQVYLVNDAFPGPTIEARSGDTLVVQVYNDLEHEGVSIHWHGLKMMGQNAFDGAVGVTQCAIPSGASFNYTVHIGDEESGTFWWHGHARLLRGDGLFGGLVVHKPHESQRRGKGTGETFKERQVSYDEERLLLVGDWFHRSGEEIFDWYESPASWAQEPVPDSMLLNGWGHFNCSMALPARPLQCTDVTVRGIWPVLGPDYSPARVTRLRIVNVGTIAGVSLAIRGMKMTPIEVDGGTRVDNHGPAADAIGILYPGERIDVILEVDSSNFRHQGSLLVSLDTESFKGLNLALQPNQSFQTRKEPLQDLSSDEMYWNSPGSILDLSNLTSSSAAPWTRHSSTSTPSINPLTYVVYARTQSLSRMDNKPMGFINHTTWRPQPQPLTSTPRSAWDKYQFVPYIPLSNTTSTFSKPTWVDLVINNLDDGAHPFHLHGHSFYVLSRHGTPRRQGWGSFNPFSGEQPPSGWNLESPMLKDTVSVPRMGHVIIRFLADNPGIWMLHCHMLIHQDTGLGMSIQIGEAENNEMAANIAAQNGQHAALCRKMQEGE